MHAMWWMAVGRHLNNRYRSNSVPFELPKRGGKVLAGTFLQQPRCLSGE